MTPIHHTFGPHATWRTCAHVKLLWLQPWRWQKGPHTENVRQELSHNWQMPAQLFAGGRESLLALLQAMQLQDGDEIIIQGYTCAVVANAIHAAGGTPVYADIGADTLNLNPNEVRRKMTNRTKAVICQHTFGIPADTATLRQLCDEHQLIFIEDCAHAMPDAPGAIGRSGDAMFFSFGRDKAISGVTGGAVLTRNEQIAARLKTAEQNAAPLPKSTIGRLLFYPCLYVGARPLYGIGLGKGLLWLSRKLGLLLPYVTKDEKQGRMSPFLHALPNACAALAYTQLQKLPQINQHRRQLTNIYLQAAKEHRWKYPEGITADMPLQKFPVFVKDADAIRAQLKKEHIYLEDGWSGAVVCPRATDQTATGYQPGTCPVAEQVGTTILNLPTHPTMSAKQAERLIRLLNKHL